MTLFLGLCGADRNPYHPTHIDRVDIDKIRWSWQRGPKPWSIDMVNAHNVDFHVRQGPIWGGIRYIALFELFMDIEPCTPPVRLKSVQPEAETGSIIRCVPGALVISNDFTKDLVKA